MSATFPVNDAENLLATASVDESIEAASIGVLIGAPGPIPRPRALDGKIDTSPDPRADRTDAPPEPVAPDPPSQWDVPTSFERGRKKSQ